MGKRVPEVGKRVSSTRQAIGKQGRFVGKLCFWPCLNVYVFAHSSFQKLRPSTPYIILKGDHALKKLFFYTLFKILPHRCPGLILPHRCPGPNFLEFYLALPPKPVLPRHLSLSPSPLPIFSCSPLRFSLSLSLSLSTCSPVLPGRLRWYLRFDNWPTRRD